MRLAVQGKAAVDVLVPALYEELSGMTARFDALSA